MPWTCLFSYPFLNHADYIYIPCLPPYFTSPCSSNTATHQDNQTPLCHACPGPASSPTHSSTMLITYTTLPRSSNTTTHQDTQTPLRRAPIYLCIIWNVICAFNKDIWIWILNFESPSNFNFNFVFQFWISICNFN